MSARLALAMLALLAAPVGLAAKRVEVETTTQLVCAEVVDAQRARKDTFEIRRQGRRVLEAHWLAEQVSTGGGTSTCDAALDPQHFDFTARGTATTATQRDGRFCSVDFVDRAGLVLVLPHCSTHYLCDQPERLRPMILNFAKQTCRPLQPAARERKPS